MQGSGSQPGGGRRGVFCFGHFHFMQHGKSLAEDGEAREKMKGMERRQWPGMNGMKIYCFTNVCKPQENSKRTHNIDMQFVEKVCFVLPTSWSICCIL